MKIELVYKGQDAEHGELDFYDASQALIGFQRTLALTTHLVLNGEIIVQAPALKGAKILVVPPEVGSWKIRAALIATAIGGLSVAPKDSFAGHVLWSAYDYTMSRALGFNVDYDKTLGKLYAEAKEKRTNEVPILSKGRFDSLIEKCEKAVIDMHRPIVMSGTATSANIYQCMSDQYPKVRGTIDSQSYLFVSNLIKNRDKEILKGKISSYNSNTYKGRIFLEKEGRAIPFELADEARRESYIALITESLDLNARRSSRGTSLGMIGFVAYRVESKTGRLKSFIVSEVFK